MDSIVSSPVPTWTPTASEGAFRIHFAHSEMSAFSNPFLSSATLMRAYGTNAGAYGDESEWLPSCDRVDRFEAGVLYPAGSDLGRGARQIGRAVCPRVRKRCI